MSTPTPLVNSKTFSFKSTFAELAPCNSGEGLAWAVKNVLKAYGEQCKIDGLTEQTIYIEDYIKGLIIPSEEGENPQY